MGDCNEMPEHVEMGHKEWYRACSPPSSGLVCVFSDHAMREVQRWSHSIYLSDCCTSIRLTMQRHLGNNLIFVGDIRDHRYRAALHGKCPSTGA